MRNEPLELLEELINATSNELRRRLKKAKCNTGVGKSKGELVVEVLRKIYKITNLEGEDEFGED